jgi:hypothetical protein
MQQTGTIFTALAVQHQPTTKHHLCSCPTVPAHISTLQDLLLIRLSGTAAYITSHTLLQQ